MKAVDQFMRTNKRIYNADNYCDLSSLYRVIDAEEYDILYGINDGDFYDRQQRSVIKNAAYKEINGKTLTVIYECPCKTTKKDNHHYNYNRPLEVVRLCRSCHVKEHHRLQLSAASPLNIATNQAVNAQAEDRLDSSQHHETAASYRESIPCMDDDRRAVAVTAELESRKCFSISLPCHGESVTAAQAINR